MGTPNRQQRTDEPQGTKARQDVCPPGYYVPDTPWINQDRTPRPVPELDSDGHPWQVTADGRHVGTHYGESYCLEWLPDYPELRSAWSPTEGLDPQVAADDWEAGA